MAVVQAHADAEPKSVGLYQPAMAVVIFYLQQHVDSLHSCYAASSPVIADPQLMLGLQTADPHILGLQTVCRQGTLLSRG